MTNDSENLANHYSHLANCKRSSHLNAEFICKGASTNKILNTCENMLQYSTLGAHTPGVTVLGRVCPLCLISHLTLWHSQQRSIEYDKENKGPFSLKLLFLQVRERFCYRGQVRPFYTIDMRMHFVMLCEWGFSELVASHSTTSAWRYKRSSTSALQSSSILAGISSLHYFFCLAILISFLQVWLK